MMDVQMAPPPYTAVGSFAPPVGKPPVLGSQIPGTTGGLPATAGLSATANPMANQLQSMGRGEDSMLIHMTPGEVNSLQGLAMAHGGSLTINPQTGLPEAGWLGKLLPTILGAALAATGVGAPAAALMVGAGQTALTGSLQKGLMAGLGAFGGAGLAGAAGVGGSLLGGNAGGLLGESAGLFGANMGFGAAAPGLTTAATGAGAGAGEAIKVTAQMPGAGAFAPIAPETFTPAVQSAIQSPLSSQIANQTFSQAASNAGQQVAAQSVGQAAAKALPSGGFFDKFAGYTKQGLGGAPKILAKNAPMVAGLGALGSVADAMQPKMPTYDEEDDDYKFEYKGPYVPGKREVSFQSDEDMRSSGGAEGTFFTPSNPPPRLLSDLTPEERIQYGYAEGGTAKLPASDDFKALVDYFNSSSPGAVTASMQPTTPKQIDTGEVVNTFNRQPSAPNIMGGGAGGFGGYNFDLSGLAGLDINSLANQYDYTQNTSIPGNIPGFSAPDIMDFGLQGRDRFEPGYRAEMLSIQSPEDMYPKYSAPAMQDLQPDFQQYSPPAMQDFQQYTPPSMQDFQYSTPSMQDFQYSTPSMQDFQYTPPAFQDSIADYGQGMGGGGGRGGQGIKRDYSANNMQKHARGGEVDMRDGSFVVDARTVSELGNGSSNAGMELLARMGGRPLQGPGDGVSDSIRARIGGKQEARVARDEVLFSPEAVKRLGKGSDKRGTAKLYSLMNKAHKARKNAKRGQDTKVRKGLA